MSSFYTAQRKFEITPEDKYLHQWPLIVLTRTNKSSINYSKIETKTAKDFTLKYDVAKISTLISNL